MAIKCILPSPSEKLFGYSESFVQRIKNTVGEFAQGADSRNVARNLGVQNDMIVNLSKANGKKIFGKNLTDPTEWDAAVAKSKGVPNDTLVTMPTPEGTTRAFLSNKKTEIFPSKWSLDDGNIMPNPDWDMVSANKTLSADGVPIGFKRLEERLYRPVKSGESPDVYLNVQNPSNAKHSIDYINQNNVDAHVREDGTYEIFHPSQAIPVRRATEKPMRGAVQKQAMESPLKDTEQVEQALTAKGIAKPVARAVAGGIAGKLADEDNEWGGAWYGGALGLFLGSPKVISKVKGVYAKTSKTFDDAYTEATNNALKADEVADKTRRLDSEGFAGDPESKLADEFEEEVITKLDETRNRGDVDEVWNGVFNNKFFTSGIYDLTSLGSKTAEKLLGIFSKIQRGSSFVTRRFGDALDEAFGRRDGIRYYKQVQEDFVRRFYSDTPDKVTTENARDAFDKAIHRIRTHGARIEEGEFRYDNTTAAEATYRGQDLLAEFDRAILADENARKVVEAFGKGYDDNATRIVKVLKEQINKELTENYMQAKHKAIAEQIVGFDGTLDDFMEANPQIYVDGVERKTSSFVKNALSKDDDFKRVMEMHDKATKIDGMKGRYIPQKIDSLKVRKAKSAWIEETGDTAKFVYDKTYGTEKYRLARTGEQPTHTLKELPEDVQDYYWDRRMSSEIIANNKDKYKLMELDTTGSDPRIKTFSSADAAASQLRKEMEEFRGDPVIRDAVLAGLDDPSSIYNFVRQVNMGGKIKYELVTPKAYRDQGINLFEYNNVNKLAESIRKRKIDYVTKRSNHFDRPRNYIIPAKYLQTDSEALMRSYAFDIGKRIISIENGMYDDKSFARHLDKIRKELPEPKSKAMAERQKEGVDRVRSWYKVIQGIDKDIKASQDGQMLSQASKNRIVLDTIFNAVGRFATAPFMYATSFYAPLQLAVMGPFLFGWKNTLKAYKLAVSNPQELKRMTQELRKMNHIHESIAAYSPEHNAAFRRDVYGDYMSETTNKFATLAEKTQDFSAKLTLGRGLIEGIGKKVSGNSNFSIEDMGFMRLFTGSLFDVSGTEASMAGMAALHHVDDLVKGANRLQKEGLDTVKIGRTQWNLDKIKRELEEFGIDNPDSFIKQKDEFDKYIDSLKGKPQTEIDEKMFDQMTNVLGSAVDKYHAKDKLARGLSWLDNPYGKLFGQFATYSQNFGVRITRERIYRPFKDWSSKYQPVAGEEDIPMFKLALAASTGNDKAFKRVFGDQWEQAYNDYPTQAINNFYKVFGALAVGKAMLVSRAGFMDITEIMTNPDLELNNIEDWRGLNKQFNIGKHPETGENVRFTELFSDDEKGYAMFMIASAALKDAVRVGFGGAMADKVLQELRYGGGIGQSFPAGSLAQGIFDTLGNVYKAPLSDVPYTFAKEISEFGLLMTPPLGTFNGLRKNMINIPFEKPKNRGNKLFDVETGLEGSIKLLDN